MNVTFDHSEAVAEGIRTFWFKPDKPVRYTAGQFTEIYLPHDNPDDRGIKRWFTLSSSPTEAMVSITTKLDPDRRSTFKHTLASLRPGTKLQLAEPMGDFVLPKDVSIPLVFIAGGIGVTPMRSMVKWLLDTGERRNIQLLYAVKSPDQLAFSTLFKTYGLDVIVVKTLKAEQTLELAKPSDQSLIYLSGPEPMVERLFNDLSAKDFNRERLVTDYFPGYRD